MIAVALLSASLIAAPAAKPAELLWLGQSAFRLTTPGGKVIVIDPFISKNPRTPQAWKDLDKLGEVDLLLVTHAHADHLGDAPALALKNKAPLYGPAGGEPVGFVIELENGLRIYHMGDTAVFGDLRLIAEQLHPDVVLVPIGGHFVLDPQDADFAVREILTF